MFFVSLLRPSVPEEGLGGAQGGVSDLPPNEGEEVQSYEPVRALPANLHPKYKPKAVKVLKNQEVTEKIQFFYANFDAFDEEKQKFIVEMSYMLLRYLKYAFAKETSTTWSRKTSTLTSWSSFRTSSARC